MPLRTGGVQIECGAGRRRKDSRQNTWILTSAELNHGIVVSNLAYEVASELGLEQESRYELAVAGMLHDIGKLKLTEYINGRERGSSSDRGAKNMCVCILLWAMRN